MTPLCCITCANPVRPGTHKTSCPLCKLELENYVHKHRELKCQSCILTEHFTDDEYSIIHKNLILKGYVSMEKARAKAEHSLYLAESKKTSIEEKIDRNELDKFNGIAKTIEQALEIQISKLEKITEENFLASELWVRNMKARLASVYQGCIANNQATIVSVAQMAGNLVFLSTATELLSSMEALVAKHMHQSSNCSTDQQLLNVCSPNSAIVSLIRQNVMDTLSKSLPLFKSHHNIKGILDSITLAKNIYVGHADLFKIHIVKSGLYVLPTVLVLPPKTTLGGASRRGEMSTMEQKLQCKFESRIMQTLTINKKHRSIIYGTIVLTEHSTIFNLYIIGRVYIVGSNVNIINCTIESTPAYSSESFTERYTGLPNCPVISKDNSMASTIPKLSKLIKSSAPDCLSLRAISQTLKNLGVELDADSLAQLERDLGIINPCLVVTNKAASALLIKSKVNSNSLTSLSFNLSHKVPERGSTLYVGPKCPILVSSMSQLYIHGSSIFCTQINPPAMNTSFQSVRLSPVLEPDTQKSVVNSAIGYAQDYTREAERHSKELHNTETNEDTAANFSFIFTPDRFLKDTEMILKGSLISVKGDSHLTMNDTHLFNSFVGVYTSDSSIHTNTCFITNCCVGSMVTDNAYDARFVYTVFSENGIGTMMHRLRNTSALYLSRYEMSSICGVVISNTAIDTNINHKYRVTEQKVPLSSTTPKLEGYEEDSIIGGSILLDVGPLSVTQSQSGEATGKPIYNTLSLRSSPALTKSTQLTSATKLPDHHCILVSKCDYQASNISCLAIVEDHIHHHSMNNMNCIMLHRNRIEVTQKRTPKGSVILQGESVSHWFNSIPMTNWIIPSANPDEYIKIIPRGADLAQILSTTLTSHTAIV